ncbi:MAG: hypothetical protein EOO38_12710 [Cytophagaceae bacterium]|nr:MAG: hypothetical protein EOO38_12710 [Cytophagaceae bacterium]
MIIIFDLDHTVIDSSHRQLTRPDGSLDLAHWKENCTREKIMADSLLPLADVMRRYYNEGHMVVVCTARVCSVHDMDYLARNKLFFHHFLSRDPLDMRGDADYKSQKLEEWAMSQYLGLNWRGGAIMFDDNVAVIERMLAEKLNCIDAIRYNKILAA